MRVLTVVALAALTSSPAVAQDIPQYDPAPLDRCLGEKPDLRLCIGVGSEACMTTDAGSSNAGMGFCLGAEGDHWDGLLNTAYQKLTEQAKKDDAEMEKLGSAAPRELPALRDMQRAWIAFRDAACKYEASRWGGGSGAGPAASECRMQLTAAQAIRLMDYADVVR